MYSDESYSLTINQNLYAGGASMANMRNLKTQYLIAKNDYRGLMQNEITKAIKAYFDIVFSRDALKANEKNIAKLRNRIRNAL